MIKVLQSGIYTSIQDTGRVGFRNIGVPLSGSMDHISAALANSLLNNEPKDAVIECTLNGPELQFNTETSVVVTGAEMSPTLNNLPIVNNKVYHINFGDTVKFGKLLSGVRSYVAVKGGIQSELILNSRSFFNGITAKAVLKKNDSIAINPGHLRREEHFGLVKAQLPFSFDNALEVYPGPEFDMLTKNEQERLFETKFSIGVNNRMGYNLENTISPHSKNMLTSPVLPGTVQMLPNGKLVVLMKDAQTTGGYPRILQLTERSMAILSQNRTGDRIIFKYTAFNSIEKNLPNILSRK
jgi:biotin-dependent carboxylase-like uncharacterized protein